MTSAATDMLNTLATPATAQLWRGQGAAPAPQPRSDGLFEDDLRQAAEQFVSTSLLTPLLAASRQDPFRSELFHGGFGEDAFMQQLDQILADRMSQRMSMPLVDAIYNKLNTNGSAPATPLPGAGVDLHG